MNLPLTATLALLLAVTSMAARADEQANIRLQEIDGRTWLVDPDGRPFFAHSVTHAPRPELNRAIRSLNTFLAEKTRTASP